VNCFAAAVSLLLPDHERVTTKAGSSHQSRKQICGRGSNLTSAPKCGTPNPHNGLTVAHCDYFRACPSLFPDSIALTLCVK
jgi:hypothetical protein